jgi:hypothetical protein
MHLMDRMVRVFRFGAAHGRFRGGSRGRSYNKIIALKILLLQIDRSFVVDRVADLLADILRDLQRQSQHAATVRKTLSAKC